MSIIIEKQFREIDLSDPFFDSLKQDYSEFSDWFVRKVDQGAMAYILEDISGLQAFLYLKEEVGSIDDVIPSLPVGRRLKVGTFKVNPHGTSLGERFIKKIFDICIENGFSQAYVTIFTRHSALINLFEKYGFQQVGIKTTPNGNENVLLKDFQVIHNDILLDYPRFSIERTNKFVLAIYPEWHSKLFPDSLLNNENFNILEDISHTNSIHKVYICFMYGIDAMRQVDQVLIYRTTDYKGPAHYRSVITSVCTIEEVKTRRDFNTINEYIDYCRKYSIFDEPDLNTWYNRRGNLWIVKMLYNAAFTKRVTKEKFMNETGVNPNYWGFFQITNTQFKRTLEIGEVNEGYIIN